MSNEFEWHEGESRATTDGNRISYGSGLHRCSCPGWNHDIYTPVARRTCLHLQELHGALAEEARTKIICDYSLAEDTRFGSCEGEIESDWFQFVHPEVTCPLEVEVQLCNKHLGNGAYDSTEEDFMKLAAKMYR